MLPNRIAVILTTICGLIVALAPVVADLDWTSTIGAVAGLAAISGVVMKWLEGWQAYEERTDLLAASPEMHDMPEGAVGGKAGDR